MAGYSLVLPTRNFFSVHVNFFPDGKYAGLLLFACNFLWVLFRGFF